MQNLLSAVLGAAIAAVFVLLFMKPPAPVPAPAVGNATRSEPMPSQQVVFPHQNEDLEARIRALESMAETAILTRTPVEPPGTDRGR